MSNHRKPIELHLITVIVLLFPPLTAFAQHQDRLLDKLSWKTEPIRVVKTKTKGISIQLGKKFSEDDDWLKGLTVTVENISTKPIARIELRLSFPRPPNSSQASIYAITMSYGKEPDASNFESLTLVPSGQAVDITLLDANLALIKKRLSDQGYPEKVVHAQVMVDSVIFADGSEWHGDETLYPNPDNPTEKINPRKPFDIVKQTSLNLRSYGSKWLLQPRMFGSDNATKHAHTSRG